MKRLVLGAALVFLAACGAGEEKNTPPPPPSIPAESFRDATMTQDGADIHVTRAPGTSSGVTLRPPETPAQLATFTVEGQARVSARQSGWTRLRTAESYSLMVGGDGVREIRILPRTDEPITIRVTSLRPCGGEVICTPIVEEPEATPSQ